MSLEHDLMQFNGTENWYPHWLGVLYTDGVHFLCNEAQCWWLLDAIASYQQDPRIKDNERLQEIQFWKLEVKDLKGRLTCREDSDIPPAVVQEISFTDFPLPEIDIWVEHGSGVVDGKLEEAMVVMLPGER